MVPCGHWVMQVLPFLTSPVVQEVQVSTVEMQVAQVEEQSVQTLLVVS